MDRSHGLGKVRFGSGADRRLRVYSGRYKREESAVKTKRNVVIVIVLAALLVGAWASVRIAENAGFVFVIAP